MFHPKAVWSAGHGGLLAPPARGLRYEFVNTPHISKEHLFEISGHLPHYAEACFPPIQFDEQNYRLKR
ncbi:hypothetical protein GCM10023238_27940 [Streptomyces heliomycini]